MDSVLPSPFFLKEIMEYTSYSKIQYYDQCSKLVEGMGFKLVDLKIVPSKTITRISAMIAGAQSEVNISVNDCAKVHRALLSRLQALLGTENTSMELTSPGIEHNIKNAREFEIFTGRNVRVWDKNVSDWVNGKILSADDKSVTLETENNEKKTVSYDDIAKAKFIYTKEEA